jgi:ATP adenylyltransferase
MVKEKPPTTPPSVMRKSDVPVAENSCIFCDYNKEDILMPELTFGRNLISGIAYCILDKYPVTKGHTLIIPKRHVEFISELSFLEMEHIFLLAKHRMEWIQSEMKDITGWNFGVNQGESAGQTISHLHFHLIPRRKNDVINPIGGIRNVIPNKGDYTAVDFEK